MKMTTNLRSSLKKGTEFVWIPQHSMNFNTIVHELCSHKLLKFYNGNKKLYLEVDASQKAIGMALLQSVHKEHASGYGSKADGCQKRGVEFESNSNIKSIIPTDLLPVVCGSKTLTDTESHYANIEHELLGVVAGIREIPHILL